MVDKYSSDLSRNSYAQIPQLVDMKNRGQNKVDPKGSESKETEEIKGTSKRRRLNSNEKEKKNRDEEQLDRKSREKKKNYVRSNGKSSEEKHE